MVALTALAFVVALMAGALVLRGVRHLPAGPYSVDKPQRFHVGDVPRLGGLAVGAGLSASWLLAAWLDGHVVRLGQSCDARPVWRRIQPFFEVLAENRLEPWRQHPWPWYAVDACIAAVCLVLDPRKLAQQRLLF